MKPRINLKQFVAVLVILIVPVALLAAYFRNYQPEAGGGGHQNMGAGAMHSPGGHEEMEKSGGEGAGHEHGEKGGGEAKAQPGGEKMDHSKMGGGAGPETVAPSADAKQLDASRAQLEASRAQLEASRQALEATKAQPKDDHGKPPAPAATPSPDKDTAPAKSGETDGHTHKH
jgi:hypothetical protein